MASASADNFLKGPETIFSAPLGPVGYGDSLLVMVSFFAADLATMTIGSSGKEHFVV